MARPPRLEFPRALYHVTARGNDRGAIFHDDRDRQEYLHRIARYRERFRFQLLAYCLMTNHVHLAIRTGEEPLSRIMACVQSSFTQWFNRRHGRVGHLFQGRYKAFLVQEQRYFGALIRYVHMNPVAAGIVGRPEDYRWSSDRFFRRASSVEFADRDEALALLGPTRSAARHSYLALMDGAGAVPDYERIDGVGRTVKGDEEFALQRISASSKSGPALRGISVDHILAAVAEVTGIPVASLCGPARGGPVAQARCLAGYIAKRLGAIPLGATARRLGREESCLLKGVSALEQTLGEAEQMARLDSVVRRLRGPKSGFLD